MDDDDDEGLADGAEARQAHPAGAAGAAAAAGGERQQEADDPHTGLLPGGAARSTDGPVQGEPGHGLEELPLHDEGPTAGQQGAAAGPHDVEAGGGRQAPGTPPTHQQQQQPWRGQQQAEDGEDKASPEASPSASSAGGGQWQPAGGQHQPVTARHGAGRDGFWRTFRDMMGDIRIVACGPERRALLVGGRGAAGPRVFTTGLCAPRRAVLPAAGAAAHAPPCFPPGPDLGTLRLTDLHAGPRHGEALSWHACRQALLGQPAMPCCDAVTP